MKAYMEAGRLGYGFCPSGFCSACNSFSPSMVTFIVGAFWSCLSDSDSDAICSS